MSGTFTVGSALGEVAGFDSIIALAPEDLYKEIEGNRVLVMKRLATLLRQLSEEAAQNLNERLHHADWVITSDPEVVRTKGLAHDCAPCRAGVDQATAYLRVNPNAEILVGMLYWAS